LVEKIKIAVAIILTIIEIPLISVIIISELIGVLIGFPLWLTINFILAISPIGSYWVVWVCASFVCLPLFMLAMMDFTD